MREPMNGCGLKTEGDREKNEKGQVRQWGRKQLPGAVDTSRSWIRKIAKGFWW